MTDYMSKSPNDCVLVAITNYFGVDRETLAAELEYNPLRGVMSDKIHEYLKRFDFISAPIPRRGQDKMTGIISLASYPKAKNRHLAVIKAGIVYDCQFPLGMPI